MTAKQHINFKLKLLITILIATFIFTQSTCSGNKTSIQPRPTTWAKKTETPGLPNLHKVSDQLYRSAQPKKNCLPALKELGIKAIFNFRDSNKTEKYIKGSDIKYYHYEMNALKPKVHIYKKFLELLSNPENQPFLVHCKHGADRTGAAVAIYRIAVQKWPYDEAIREMTKGGYNFHSIHKHLKDFIKKFITELENPTQ